MILFSHFTTQFFYSGIAGTEEGKKEFEAFDNSQSMAEMLTYLEDCKAMNFFLKATVGGKNPIDRLTILSRFLALLNIIVLGYTIYAIVYDV